MSQSCFLEDKIGIFDEVRAELLKRCIEITLIHFRYSLHRDISIYFLFNLFEEERTVFPEENHSTASVVSQHANSCIKIAHLNIRSLKSREHRFLLQHTIADHDFDIFTISETWLDSTVDNQVVQIPGFVFFRQGRGEHKSGGGLAVYIRDTFKATLLEHASGISELELLCSSSR